MIAVGVNPQKTSVSYEDNTGIPAPKPHKKLDRNNKKSHSYKVESIGSSTATGRGLKPCKDSSDDLPDEQIIL